MTVINSPKAPAAIGPYSQAICVNDLVFTSGQIPINPQTGSIDVFTIEEQTEQVIKNIQTVLEEASSSLEKAVKTTCFLKNMSDFDAFNKVYAKYFTGKPARSCFEVAALPKNSLVEIEVIACK